MLVNDCTNVMISALDVSVVFAIMGVSDGSDVLGVVVDETIVPNGTKLLPDTDDGRMMFGVDVPVPA